MRASVAGSGIGAGVVTRAMAAEADNRSKARVLAMVGSTLCLSTIGLDEEDRAHFLQTECPWLQRP